MTDIPESSGLATARWWATQLGSPTFKATDERGSAQDQENMGLASMMAQMAVGSSALTQEQADTFVTLLAGEIDEGLAKTGYMNLGVDYGPDWRLADIAGQAGIPTSRFPWKTTTWSYPDHVVAALGYGAAEGLVWTAPDWERPACGVRRYADTADGYEQLPEVCGLPRYHEEREHGSWTPKEVDPRGW